MKKLFYSFLIFLISFLAGQNARAQSGCEALFEYNQLINSLQIQFTDLSISDLLITSWSWDCGDGAISTQQHPLHTYSPAGNYDVCLTIVDADGCQSTICHTVIVQALNMDCHSGFAYN